MSGERFGFDDLAWDELVDATIEILRGVARQRSTIPYGQLARELRRRGQPDVDPHYGPMPHLLESASLRVRERDPTAPLISALVYRQDTNRPGDGFFKLAVREGYTVADQEAFWARHVEQVHDWEGRR